MRYLITRLAMGIIAHKRGDFSKRELWFTRWAIDKYWP